MNISLASDLPEPRQQENSASSAKKHNDFLDYLIEKITTEEKDVIDITANILSTQIENYTSNYITKEHATKTKENNCASYCLDKIITTKPYKDYKLNNTKLGLNEEKYNILNLQKTITKKEENNKTTNFPLSSYKSPLQQETRTITFKQKSNSNITQARNNNQDLYSTLNWTVMHKPKKKSLAFSQDNFYSNKVTEFSSLVETINLQQKTTKKISYFPHKIHTNKKMVNKKITDGKLHTNYKMDFFQNKSEEQLQTHSSDMHNKPNSQNTKTDTHSKSGTEEFIKFDMNNDNTQYESSKLNNLIDKQAICTQINNNLIKNFNKVGKTLSFKLDPEELGEIKVKIDLAGKNIFIETSYEQVKNILQDNIRMLENNLTKSGFENMNFCFENSNYNSNNNKAKKQLNKEAVEKELEIKQKGLLNLLV